MRPYGPGSSNSWRFAAQIIGGADTEHPRDPSTEGRTTRIRRVPGWCNGSHDRLKIDWGKPREGSNPSPGTKPGGASEAVQLSIAEAVTVPESA